MYKAFNWTCLVIAVAALISIIYDWIGGAPAGPAIWGFAVLGCFRFVVDTIHSLRPVTPATN